MAFTRHPPPEELDTDEENDANIDPELRLRTVRTAASAIAESINAEQRAEKRKLRRGKSRFSRFRSLKKKSHHHTAEGTEASEHQERPTTSGSSRRQSVPLAPAGGAPEQVNVPQMTGSRRTVYVNMQPGPEDLDSRGEPTARYARNKVRTTKYTLVTFLPKNLTEQFIRAANVYFLVLIIIQVFPLFGAAGAQVAMLPLVFILTVTAIKDGIEDWRRARLDDEVNNSAVTKLGSWRNTNLPQDSRAWWDRLTGRNKPGQVSRGVRRLREKEASQFGNIVLAKNQSTDGSGGSMSMIGEDSESVVSGRHGRLEDIMSVDEHSYPPSGTGRPGTLKSMDEGDGMSMQHAADARQRVDSMPSVNPTNQSRISLGVVDWKRRTRGTACWERTLWKKLEVGDIVLIRDNEQVPADIVVLSTSDPDGLCYLETKNLDGETNLKVRKSLNATSTISSEEDMEHATFYVDSEPPHQNLYLYNGVMRYEDAATGEEKQEPITINELLLRGCTVRNTSWIIGVVVFTGADTKIMMNGGDTPSKRSKIEKETNFNVVMNFVILVFMCGFSAVASGIYDGLQDTSKKFYEPGVDPTNSPALNGLITFATALIIFQNIVPVALYITIEIVKTIQAYFILQDIDMYYEPFDTTCVPKTWNISDDLGQIEYIFSDKTGTLTQNVMEFQKCSVNGVAYGEGVTEAQRGAAVRDGGNAGDSDSQSVDLASMKDAMVQRMNRAFKNRYLREDKLTLVSPRLADDLANRGGPQRPHLIAFFRALAICHTVLSDKPDPDQPFVLDYKAESPDEAALVAAARDVGFPFVTKTGGNVEIEVMGQVEKYALLKVLEFNSSRKRMSVVVRNPEGRLILYCKGADSVIYARLAADHDLKLKDATSKDMETFANGGLRTLTIAYRYLSEEEYLDWSRTYDNAAASINNRDEEIEKANELIEHSLYILGATALEDKLQEGVPQAIETLHQAGIKLWILTGDKLQTAIEIGYSCNLLKTDMDVMIISAGSAEAARTQIEGGLNKIASILGPPSFNSNDRGFVPGAKASFAVVIDGETLGYALQPELKPLFLTLGTQCETVVCCRVSPSQKALVVKLVKEGRDAMTLAIGDGANDVAMIQAANIGCGLFGHEGSQAAMSADYAFGQFRFLTKLLLVHGRWSYTRVADMHTNFFYKNIIWTLAMFWYLFFTSYDAAYLYDYSFILLYALVFTSLPVGFLGAFDQDLNAKAALAFPQLYVRGIRGLEYTKTKFWLYMLDGLYQSAVVFFIPYGVWILGTASSWNGRNINSQADFGTTIAFSAIVAANTYVGINTHYWTVLAWIVNIGSSVVMLLWVLIYSFFNTPDFNDEVIILFGELTFWATVIISVIMSLAPRFLTKFFKQAYMPLDKDIVREMWIVGDLKDRLGIKHRKNSHNRPLHDFESAPMFKHDRGYSEMSLSAVPYMPAAMDSPAATPPRTPRHFDSSDHVHPQMGQVTNADGAHELLVEDGHDREGGVATPNTPHSPWPSYYSASEIPMATPASTNFRHPSPPPTAASSNPNFAYPRRLQSPPRSLRSPPGLSGGAYELQEVGVRTPTSGQHLQSPPPERTNFSRASGRSGRESFVTAEDGGWMSVEEEVEDDQTIAHGRGGSAHAV